MNPVNEILSELLWILDENFPDLENEYLTKLVFIRQLIDEVLGVYPQPPQVFELNQVAVFNYFVSYLNRKNQERNN